MAIDTLVYEYRPIYMYKTRLSLKGIYTYKNMYLLIYYIEPTIKNIHYNNDYTQY